MARPITHGMSYTREYDAWASMRKRCSNPNHKSYANYGERGIKVCKRWNAFTNFFEDMGERPAGEYSLERIDNEKGYSPENCKWATRSEQHNNQRTNNRLTYKGRTLSLAQWAKELGMAESTIRNRKNRGLTDAQVLSTPVDTRNNQPLFGGEK